MLPEVKQVPLDALLVNMVVITLERVSGGQISLAKLGEMMLRIYSRPQQKHVILLQSLDVALMRMELERKILVSGERGIPLFTYFRLP